MADAPSAPSGGAFDSVARGACFCLAPYHAPHCRIGVMLARLERPKDLSRVISY